MYQKIIVALSLEHGYGERGLEIARRLKADGGTIQAVHVHEQPHPSVGAYLDDEVLAMVHAEARGRLKEKIGNAPDVEPVLLKGHSGATILEYAASCGADLIVVGSHKPGLRDYFLGSTAARIVRHAPCSVHVLRADA